jgi:hypothetical protein
MKSATAGSMLTMNGTGYKLLGYLVWHGTKWHLRRIAPSPRTAAAVGIGAFSVLAGTALLARRLRG